MYLLYFVVLLFGHKKIDCFFFSCLILVEKVEEVIKTDDENDEEEVSGEFCSMHGV